MISPTSSPPVRTDPISTRYYRQTEIAESISTWLFYVAALASFAPFLIEKKSHSMLYSAALVCFVLAVLCVFLIGAAIRLYFFPRAEDARRKDFVSNSFGFDLIEQRTVGYYNNSEKNPFKRMGLSVLENLYFSKSILREMAPGTRAKALLYLLTWIAVVLWRDTPLDWAAAAAQVLFSEEIVARWLRLEWARSRAERIYEGTHRLFQSRPAPDRLSAYAIEAFGEYETGKAVSAILLSQKIFERLNPRLTSEWEDIKKGLA